MHFCFVEIQKRNCKNTAWFLSDTVTVFQILISAFSIMTLKWCFQLTLGEGKSEFQVFQQIHTHRHTPLKFCFVFAENRNCILCIPEFATRNLTQEERGNGILLSFCLKLFCFYVSNTDSLETKIKEFRIAWNKNLSPSPIPTLTCSPEMDTAWVSLV